MQLRLLPVGDRAVLVEPVGWTDPADAERTAALYLALRAGRPAGVLELVPAERTVLVRFDPELIPAAEVGSWLRAAEVAAQLGGRTAGSPGPAAESRVEIPVMYDGADLDEVGRLTGLGRDGVVAAHTGTPWRVAFTGFAPGFGYLIGGDPRLRVPRRDVSRTRVPAGSVGLAGRYSGIYPRESPGGWQLLGRTSATVWDADREPPALLRPGVTVRFVPMDRR